MLATYALCYAFRELFPAFALYYGYGLLCGFKMPGNLSLWVPGAVVHLSAWELVPLPVFPISAVAGCLLWRRRELI